MRQKGLPKPPESISFRLSETYMNALMKRAAGGRVSAGEYARQVVIDHMEDAMRERLEEELYRLQTEIAFLRGDFATTVEALLVLVGAGNVKPLEAQAWVEERLRQVSPKET
jgi:hypothetical protein